MKHPLPFPAFHLVELTELHGPNRFVEGVEPRHLSRGFFVRFAEMVRDFPLEAEWIALIRYLEAGGLPGLRPPYHPSVLVCEHAREWMAMAAEWEKKHLDLETLRADARLHDLGINVMGKMMNGRRG